MLAGPPLALVDVDVAVDSGEAVDAVAGDAAGLGQVSTGGPVQAGVAQAVVFRVLTPVSGETGGALASVRRSAVGIAGAAVLARGRATVLDGGARIACNEKKENQISSRMHSSVVIIVVVMREI